MGVLKNPRHEAFARNVALRPKNGWTLAECYVNAGYEASGNGAEVNAVRLLKRTKPRVRELAEPAARKATMTVEALIDDLDRIMTGAEGDRQWAAAKAAIDSKAKLKGLWIDRHEVGGPGDFSSLETEEEVADWLISQLGGAREALDVIEAIRVLIEPRVAEQAVDITPPEAEQAPRKVDEAGKALELLRPARR